jgi:hypothetical protein
MKESGVTRSIISNQVSCSRRAGTWYIFESLWCTVATSVVRSSLSQSKSFPSALLHNHIMENSIATELDGYKAMISRYMQFKISEGSGESHSVSGLLRFWFACSV